GAMLDQFRPDVQGNSPFIVGVSGHRDLDPAELPRLKNAVAAFVTQLKSYLPDTEVHMLVGMAPGADLLVVETALDLNVQVEAVLPMLDQFRPDVQGNSPFIVGVSGHREFRGVEIPVTRYPHDEWGISLHVRSKLIQHGSRRYGSARQIVRPASRSAKTAACSRFPLPVELLLRNLEEDG